MQNYNKMFTKLYAIFSAYSTSSDFNFLYLEHYNYKLKSVTIIIT